MRLETLEKRVAALLAAIPKSTTLEEFKSKWEAMSPIDKSLYVGIAECPELFGICLDSNGEIAAICEYLEAMGCVGEKFNLKDIVDELEQER